MPERDTRARIIAHLRRKKAETTNRIAELSNWLTDHVSDNAFQKVLSDKRALEVKLHTICLNIDQVKQGLPSHGEPMPKSNNEQPNNQFKSNL